MKAYAEKNGYELAAVFGVSAYSAHYYFVRSDFPESAELVRRIREMDYFLGGRKAVDFSALERSSPKEL